MPVFLGLLFFPFYPLQPCSGLTWKGPSQEMAILTLDLPLWYWGQVGSALGDPVVKKNVKTLYSGETGAPVQVGSKGIARSGPGEGGACKVRGEIAPASLARSLPSSPAGFPVPAPPPHSLLYLPSCCKWTGGRWSVAPTASGEAPQDGLTGWGTC